MEETDHQLHGFQALYLPYLVIHQVLLCGTLLVVAVVIVLAPLVLVELVGEVTVKETTVGLEIMSPCMDNTPQVVAVEEQKVDLALMVVLLYMPRLLEVKVVLVDQV
jgi:hypothetical protein